MLNKNLLRKIIEYDDSDERIPQEEREKRLTKRMRDTIAYAYKNAPAQKQRFDKIGITPSDIRTIKDLEKIPVMKMDDIIKLQRANPPFGGLLTVPINALGRIGVSPGPYYRAQRLLVEDQKARLRRLWRFYHFQGARPGDIVIITASFHMVPAGVTFLDDCDALGITVIPAGPGQTDLQVQIMRELGVTGIMGFPSFTMAIIKRAEDMGYDFRRDFKVRWAQVMGERHGPMLRKIFEKDYGLQTTHFYGGGAAGAYECEKKNGMHFDEENGVFEICDPETGKQLGPGEVGEIVGTNFNKFHPLIRLGTSDLASYTNEPCPCGRTTPRISNILGMIGDHIKVKGLFVHKREVEEVLAKMPEISKAQMVLTLREYKDTVNFRIELAGEGIDAEAFRQRFTKVCQDTFRLRPDNIEFIPRGTLPKDYKQFADQRWGKG